MAKTILIKCVVALLIASMLVIGFVSCGGPITTTQTTTTSSTDNTDTPGTDNTESSSNVDYPTQLEGIKSKTNGKTIQFAYVEARSGTYVADSIWVDSEAVDLDDVDKAIIERNNKVADDLGVTILAIDYECDISGLQAATKTIFDNQGTDIDVYCGYQYYDISLATQKHLYNLNDLTNDLGDTLIDTSKGYWATNYIDSISYNDYTYWVTGDLALLYSGGLYCTYVNTALYDQYVKNAYESKSIYQIVNEGNWTMDTMITMARLAANDADGNGKITDGETAGIVYENVDIWDGLAFGCQVEFGKKVSSAAGDEITIAFGSDTKAKTLAGFCNTIYQSTNFSLDIGESDSRNMMPYFASGKALFAINKIYMSAIYLTEMESFAIIPTPKLNATQKNYASGCHDSLTIFGISRYSDVAEAAAATLELMAYYGNQIVTPVFYKNYILGSRTVREVESMAMIELIRNGFDSDFVAAWSNKINGIVQFYRTPTNVAQFAYITKKNSNTWPTSLSSLLTALEEAALDE